MKSQQQQFRNNEWISFPSDINADQCQLVLAFGAPEIITDENIYKHLKEQYPHADILMASTAGEIINGEVFDNTVVATAIELEKTENKVLMTVSRQHKVD